MGLGWVGVGAVPQTPYHCQICDWLKESCTQATRILILQLYAFSFSEFQTRAQNTWYVIRFFHQDL
jgi:hypothetical protein